MARKSILIIFGILLLGFLIRIYKIDNTSLFGDELDFGYQALSFFETGKDYYGNVFPTYFHSLSEWKTSAFVYTLSPFVGIFGVNNLGVRLPSIIFGTLTLLFIYLLTKELTRNDFLALVAAFFMSIVPWHVHYSRIGFETSEMLFTYIAGIYFFYKALGFASSAYKAQTNYKLLPFSAFFLAVSFVVYRTQLIFVPGTLLLLVLSFRKELLSISKKYLVFSILIFLIISLPYAYQTFLGPGSQRFSTISIFDSEKMNYDVGILRTEDEKYQKTNLLTRLSSQFFHNKYTYFSDIIANNIFEAYSTEFLFVSGDPNPRHNVPGQGELYKYQFIFLLIGLFLFVDKKINRRSKILILSWLILSPLSSSLTRDGANHATRLFMLLLPFSIIFSYGVYFVYTRLKTKITRKLFWVVFAGVSLIFLVNFLHIYFIHYPSASEDWWPSGFKEAIDAAILEEGNFDRIIISSASQPAEIFFLAWSAYPPKNFQNNLFAKKFDLKGFGRVSELDKFLFTETGVGKDLYSLSKDLPNGYLYLATAKEISLDLVAEPERIPSDLRLVKTTTYPSGRPAYYLFSKK